MPGNKKVQITNTKHVLLKKKNPLFAKKFTICTTVAYFLDILLPYLTNRKDEQIMKEIIEYSNRLCKLMNSGDIFVLDRSLRDDIPDLY